MKPQVKYPYHQSPFFKLKSKRKLADLLMLKPESIKEILALINKYRRVWKHKKENKWLNEAPDDDVAKDYRPIDIPHDKLKKVQRRIASLFDRIFIPDNVYSPVKGRSYIDNAAAHKSAEAVYSMDIEKYFPSTNIKKIIGFFSKFLHCSSDVAVILANIVSKDGYLPQGSPCSPVLAYHVNHRMWDEITSLCVGHNCLATIYADDLTISGAVVPSDLIYKVRGVIRKHGMSVQREKDKSSFRRPNKITGVVVKAGRLLLPNNKHLKIKEAVDRLREAVSSIDEKVAATKVRSRKAQRVQVEKANDV